MEGVGKVQSDNRTVKSNGRVSKASEIMNF
jgi:hypothetical protein